MEELDEEQGISNFSGMSGFHLTDHDYAISIQVIHVKISIFSSLSRAYVMLRFSS